MEDGDQFTDISRDISKIFGAILTVVGERILGNLCSEKISFTDLGLVATILQKLIDCHIALKSLVGCGTVASAISREVIDSIQTQLDLL